MAADLVSEKLSRIQVFLFHGSTSAVVATHSEKLHNSRSGHYSSFS